MKRMYQLLPIFVLFVASTSFQTAEVYICISKTASKYHYDRDCRGLAQCTHKIEKVTLKKAKELGYKDLCGWED